MRLRWGGVWTHILIQVLGTSMVIAGFGVGYTLAGDFGIVCLLSFPCHALRLVAEAHEAHTNYLPSASKTHTPSSEPQSSDSSSYSPSWGLLTTSCTGARGNARSSAWRTAGTAARSSFWLSSMAGWDCSWRGTRGLGRLCMESLLGSRCWYILGLRRFR